MLPEQYHLLACYFEKNSTSEEFENNLQVCTLRLQINLSRSAFKFITQRGGVYDLTRFLVLENPMNLKRRIDM